MRVRVCVPRDDAGSPLVISHMCLASPFSPYCCFRRALHAVADQELVFDASCKEPVPTRIENSSMPGSPDRAKRSTNGYGDIHERRCVGHLLAYDTRIRAPPCVSFTACCTRSLMQGALVSSRSLMSVNVKQRSLFHANLLPPLHRCTAAPGRLATLSTCSGTTTPQ